MAELNEISQITINDNIYNLCDATARNHLVSKHGGTVDGNIVFTKNDNDTYSSIYFRPNGKTSITNWSDDLKGKASSGYVTAGRNTSDNDPNKYYLTLGVQGVAAGATSYSYIQSLRLGGIWDSAKNKWIPSVYIPNQAKDAWCNAIGAVNTYGNNTINNGSLTINAEDNSTGYLKINDRTSTNNTTSENIGRIYIPATGYVTTRDTKENMDYALIGDNGTNLWIGANKGGSASSLGAHHHSGGTYLSAGWKKRTNTTDPWEPNESIYISVLTGKNSNGSDKASNYLAYHSGNLTNAFTVVYKTYTFTGQIETGYHFYNFKEKINNKTENFTKFSKNLRPIAAWGTLADTNNLETETEEHLFELFSSGKIIDNNLIYSRNITQVILSPAIKDANYTKVAGGFWYHNLTSDRATYSGGSSLGGGTGTSNVTKSYKANIAFLCIPW